MVYKNRTNQQYEEYWKVTLAITDFDGNEKFYDAIQIIKNAIDSGFKFNQQTYKELQEEIISECGQGWKGKAQDTNARKLINQTVKLGLFSHKLESYPEEVNQLLVENKENRKIILSRIILENNKLNGSVTNVDSAKTNRIKFLISTIENNELVTKENLAGIMISNPDDYPQGYLNKEELNQLTQKIKSSEFLSRKYNQYGHFKSVLIYGFSNYFIYSKSKKGFVLSEQLEIVERIFDGSFFGQKPVRSQVDQQNYRDLLILENEKFYGISENNSRARDTVFGKEFSKRKMIASHIFPYRSCHRKAEYDPNNGMLLGEDLDYWFDNGSIGIDDEGRFLVKENVDEVWKEDLKNTQINKHFLNQDRKKYLKIHRVMHGFETITEDQLRELLLSFNNIETAEVEIILNLFDK